MSSAASRSLRFVARILAFHSVLAWAIVDHAAALDLESGAGCIVGSGMLEFDCDGRVGWEQWPNDASAFSAQVDIAYPFESAVADNFSGNGRSLVGAGWWGVYWNGSTAQPDHFTVRIHADDGGRPGDVLFSEVCVECEETYAEATTADYCVNFSAPFPTETGAVYWLEIGTALTYPPQWGWATGDGDGNDVWFAFPALGIAFWTRGEALFGRPSNMAFVLFEEPDFPVSEASWSSVKALYR